jgi:hypothetical protein
VLAASVPPLAIITLNRGLSSRFDKHRTIARWTLPIWLYVSITGVVVYLMLYNVGSAFLPVYWGDLFHVEVQAHCSSLPLPRSA